MHDVGIKEIMNIKNLIQLPVLKRLPQDVLQLVSEKGVFERVTAGTVLCREAEEATGVIWIISGRVKTAIHMGSKDETVISIKTIGDKVGLFEVCEGGQSTVSAQTLEETCVFRLSKAVFVDLLETEFDFLMAVFGNVSFEMRGAVKEINDLKLKNTSRRLGAYLLAMTPQEVGAVDIQLPFGKRLLAARLAMKPESLSRALSKLKSIGVGSDRNHVHVANIKALKDYCGDDEDLLEGAMS